MEAKTIYIKLEKDGKIVVNQHRVWDTDKFLASQFDQYSGAKVKPEDKYKVSLSNHKEYIKLK